MKKEEEFTVKGKPFDDISIVIDDKNEKINFFRNIIRITIKSSLEKDIYYFKLYFFFFL